MDAFDAFDDSLLVPMESDEWFTAQQLNGDFLNFTPLLYSANDNDDQLLLMSNPHAYPASDTTSMHSNNTLPAEMYTPPESFMVPELLTHLHHSPPTLLEADVTTEYHPPRSYLPLNVLAEEAPADTPPLYHVPDAVHREVVVASRPYAKTSAASSPLDRFFVQKLATASIRKIEIIQARALKNLLRTFDDCADLSMRIQRQIADPAQSPKMIENVCQYVTEVSGRMLQAAHGKNHLWKVVQEFHEIVHERFIEDEFRFCFLAVPQMYGLSTVNRYSFVVQGKEYNILVPPARRLPPGLLLGPICLWTGYSNDFVGIARLATCPAPKRFHPDTLFSSTADLEGYITIAQDERKGVIVIAQELGALRLMMSVRQRYILHSICDPIDEHRRYLSNSNEELVPLIPRELLHAHVDVLWKLHLQRQSTHADPSTMETVLPGKRKRKSMAEEAASNEPKIRGTKKAKGNTSASQEPINRAAKRLGINIGKILKRYTFGPMQKHILKDVRDQLQAVIDSI